MTGAAPRRQQAVRSTACRAAAGREGKRDAGNGFISSEPHAVVGSSLRPSAPGHSLLPSPVLPPWRGLPT